MAIKKINHSRGTSYEVTTKVDGRIVRRRFPTARAARDEEARLRVAAREGTFIAAADARLTLDAYTQTWFAGLAVRPSTLANYHCRYDHHIAPAFGSTRLDRIHRQDVLAFLNRLRATGLAESTVQAVYNLLRMVLRSAVLDRKLHASPCYKITLPPLPSKQLAVLLPEQVQALLSHATTRDRAVLAIAVGTGLRQAELLGVTLEAVDLEAGQLSVVRQLVTPPGPGRPTLTPLLKTAASQRVLPLPRFVIEALREHLKLFGTGQDGLLFPNPRGQGWRRGSFNDSVWKPALRRAGLDTRFGLHACRHSYASTLIAQGLPARVIQARLGHASIVETMDTYGHLFPEAQAETADALDRVYGPAAPRLRAV